MAEIFVKLKSIRESTLAAIGIWVIYLAGYPFSMRYAFGYPFMIPLCAGLGLLIILLCRHNNIKFNKVIISLFLILFCFWVMQMLFRVDISYASNLFQIFITATVYLSIINFIGIKSMAQQFANFMIVNCICGSIVAIILIFYNFPPMFEYIAHDGRIARFFYLTFTNTAYDLGNMSIIRYAGLFDEPGTLSLFSMYALLLNKVILKNRRIEIFLIILPLLTFSLAHFITVILYIFFFKIKKFRTIAFVVLFMGLAYFALDYSKDTEYKRLYQLTIGRMQKNESGMYKGDNRSNLNATALDFFKEKPLFGAGKTFFENKKYPIGGISFFGAMYGIMGYIFLYILFFYAIFMCLFKNSEFSIWLDGVKCCTLIAVNLFQRPDMASMFQLFAITLFITCVSEVTSKNEESKRIIFKRRERNITASV